MSLTASDKGGTDFEITPEGTYIARCYRIIDLGTQTSQKYGNESHKVMISWELFDDENKMADGRPYSVHNTYTVSLGAKANLRRDLEAWRGKKFTVEELEGFDLGNVLGAYCMIQVVHSPDGQFANVQAIMSYKGDKPAPVNPNVVFDIDEPDMDVFNAMSDNMKAKIMSAPEWQDRKTESGLKDLAPLSDEMKLHNSATQTSGRAVIADSEKEFTKDTVIEDFGDEPISLEDIPF